MHLTSRPQLYRVWITVFERWQPRFWHEVPPHAVAETPAEEECLLEEEAAQYLEAFNEAMLAQPGNRWAVAVPVAMCYEGDLHEGQRIDPVQLVRHEIANGAAGR